jgi:hypothetical protein
LAPGATGGAGAETCAASPAQGYYSVGPDGYILAFEQNGTCG